MPLKSPNLDDRDFQQLLTEAVSVVKKYSPQWTDLTPSDPGMVLLEAFAYLTEVMIYRLNRLPEKAYIEFLRLMGVKLYPPSAASVSLRFSVSKPLKAPIEIPRGTRVTIARASSGGEAPVFITSNVARIEPNAQSVEVQAFHCELVEGEVLGIGTGLPGQIFTVKRPPIIAPTGDDLDLIVGVEALPQELGERVKARQQGAKVYRIWTEVENLAEIKQDKFVYLTDRVAGTINFAPAVRLPVLPQKNTDEDADKAPDKSKPSSAKKTSADEYSLSLYPQSLAEVPLAGREICVWYRRGGGVEGNLSPNTLTVLKDPIAGVDVTNPEAATGGRPTETLENALHRGPLELHSLERAVTARDFEQFALNSSGAVARAKAFTKATIWKHAPLGTVEVLLVPFYLPEEDRSLGAVTSAKLQEQETVEALSRIQAALDERRPLGTACLVNWVRYKVVRIKARIVIHRGEDPAAVKARVLDRLHQTVNPLPTKLRRSGWGFGQPLRLFDIYDTARQEPGVRYVDNVKFLVDDVPEKDVTALAADFFQPRTWYAGAGSMVFRSLNDGNGWELSGQFETEKVDVIRPHPNKAGLLAVVADLQSATGSHVHVSADCGETWKAIGRFEFKVHDVAWMMRDELSILFLATDKGLYELSLSPNASPVPVQVDEGSQTRGFYAVAVTRTVRGTNIVAVAAQGAGGVLMSEAGGKSGTFKDTGLEKNLDVRVLEIEQDGPRAFLWAGVAIGGNDADRGCFRKAVEGSAEGWRNFVKGWTGGSCRGLAFQGAKIFAATHHSGIAWLDSSKEDPVWQSPGIRCGLPSREATQNRIFQPVEAVAARLTDETNVLMAGGIEGVYRSDDGGTSYTDCSSNEFEKIVTIPETWLLCSGEHAIQVVSEDEQH